MRVGLITWGTEGDVRPFFSLARALSQRGHRVEMEYVNVEGRTFEALARACGVEATPFAGEYFRANREALHRASAASLERASPPEQFEMILRDLMDPIADEMLSRSLAIASRSDVVVGHVLAHPVATATAKADVPYAAVALQPVFRSKHYPPAGASNGGRLFNPLLWKLADWIMRRVLDPRIAAQRSALGLPPNASTRAAHRPRVGFCSRSRRRSSRAPTTGTSTSCRRASSRCPRGASPTLRATRSRAFSTRALRCSRRLGACSR